MKYKILIVFITVSINLQAQEIEIGLKNGTDQEKKGKAQLERIVAQYHGQIEKWIFTTKVEIDENAIPFSHPVLTLNCNDPDNDVKQLSNFFTYLFDKIYRNEQSLSWGI